MYESKIRAKIQACLQGNCCFIGTYGRDEIPRIKKRPAAIIVNTALAHEEGEHWVAIYLDKNKSAFYFDSFGLPPMHKEILNFLHSHSNTVGFNNVTLQTPSPSSVTCGHYCILFVVFRCKGMALEKMINLFTRNTFLNDVIVRKLLKM